MTGRRKVILAGAWITMLLVTWVTSVALESFDPVFERTDRFRMGDEVELSGSVSTDSFTFFRNRITTIRRSEFERLIGDRGSQLPVSLKILADGDLVVGYELSRSVRLEETRKDDEPRAWKKVELVQIASYPRSLWPSFLKRAVSHGMREYRVIEDEGDFHVSLTFSQTDPSRLQFGGKVLDLPDNFYHYMRIEREFVPWAGDDDKFVILVHEPHWCLAGQYQLIAGLKTLLKSNSSQKFKFLVEGYFTEEIKHIPTSPLLTQFSSDASRAEQVFSLLRSALIDGPLAYRLIYDPDLPAVAIDDPDLIRRTLPEQRPAGLFRAFDTLIKISEKLEESSSSRANDAYPALNTLALYIRAELNGIRGQPLIDFKLEQAARHDALCESLRGFSSDMFSEEISFLRTEAEAYRTGAKRFQTALERDAVMATNIEEHFSSKDLHDHIPVAFIGNFHTSAIVSHLHSKGIGYVVVGPLDFVGASETEHRNFNRALNLGARHNYLRELAGDLKSPVAPTSDELPYYRAFLRRSAVPRIERENKHAHQSFESLGPTTINWALLRGALETNGFLSGAEVSFADRGVNPPPPFTNGFAYFSVEPQGRPPKLVFLQPEEKGWEREDRYRLLGRVSLVAPREEIRGQTRKVRFYQDQETNRIFCSYFDSESQRFYLFEGERIDIFNTLPMPKIQGEEEALIHLLLSLRNSRAGVKERSHG